jgi:hypothetical protein
MISLYFGGALEGTFAVEDESGGFFIDFTLLFKGV